MALLTFKAPVDYAAQQGKCSTALRTHSTPLLILTVKAAFEDFLSSYKATGTSEQLAGDALGDLNIEEDGLSDEYDFMDDATNGEKQRQRSGRSAAPRHKYMDQLQKVADRELNQITIELDDLDNVRNDSLPPATSS